jgi:hypothetical protein
VAQDRGVRALVLSIAVMPARGWALRRGRPSWVATGTTVTSLSLAVWTFLLGSDETAWRLGSLPATGE